MKKSYNKWLLILVIAFPLCLALPKISLNIDDPNMIVYFSADEGGMMDLIWHYFSGEKRNSFQWDVDYGLEMRYMADIAKIFLSKFIDFTPGLFAVILRYTHLLFWIFSIIALYFLVLKHFKSEWQGITAAALLCVRPAFAYLTNSVKPEPVVLFFVIMSLHFVFSIIDDPFRKKNLFLAVLFASTATLVKFSGLFILPAIIAAMYFSETFHKDKRVDPFREIRSAWLMPAFAGIVMMGLLSALITCYVRKSTGLTWQAEYGFLGTIKDNIFMSSFFILSLSMVFFSVLIFSIQKTGITRLKRAVKVINTFNSKALTVILLFLGCSMLLGFRWILKPGHFINIYSQIGPMFLASEPIESINQAGFFNSFFGNLRSKIIAFDPLIFSLFIVYIVSEIMMFKKNIKGNKPYIFKRLTLIVFLIPFFLIMLSMGRMEQHNMVPFFAAIIILSLQGIHMISVNKDINANKRQIGSIILALIVILDLSVCAHSVIRQRVYQFKKQKDAAFYMKDWLKANIPYDANIISGHYIRVYIPEEYKNIRTFNANKTGGVEQFIELVSLYKPEYIYYNTGPCGGVKVPPAEELFKQYTPELLKCLYTKGRGYQRLKGDCFVVYKLHY